MVPFEVVSNNRDMGAVIKVVGIGSGGVNAVNTMLATNIEGVEYIAMNSDFQHLGMSRAEICIELGGATKGRGAGGDPNKGREAAIQERAKIEEYLRGADMVVLATGLGGGTGTGATPVVAELARSMGILTVAVVTLPFSWEGRSKMRRAMEGLEVLRAAVDAYVVIPNEKIKKLADKGLTSLKAFAMVDQVLCDSMTGLVELITHPGYINRDFEDVKTVLAACGLCVMGTGTGGGENRALDAVNRAISNPLLEDTPIEGARHVLINIIQGLDGTVDEQEQIMERINECMAQEGEISYGLAFDEKMGDQVKVTIIASGMGDIEMVDPRSEIEESETVGRGLSLDTRSMLSQGSRPGLAEGTQERPIRGTRNLPLFNMAGGQQVIVPVIAEGDSELDPTPAYLRLNADASARDGLSMPGYQTGGFTKLL